MMRKRRDNSLRYALNQMNLKNYKPRLIQPILTKKGLLKWPKINLENNKNS